MDQLKLFEMKAEPNVSGQIVTFTGKRIEPLNPDPDLIVIEDIAHALSNNCRFTGHVKKFYSVGQHSILVSQIVNWKNSLTGLLHDASEAYLSDIARPVKSQPGFGEVYKETENRLMGVIALKFDIEWPIPEDVKWADDVLLRSEQRDLMPNYLRLDGTDYLDFTIDPWTPAEVEERFLNRYYEIKGES